MGSIMIRCPVTGSAIPTGMRADRATFSRTPVFIARVFCALCRTEHEWFAKDAWVDEPLAEPLHARGAGAQPRCEAA
ncbi:MAG: hypothetical protein IT538_03255 [Variibacter sp.]|nr:hypothetical protein [Variibacter sp.]